MAEAEADLRAHLARLQAVKIRYDRGDGLYGPAAVGTLLREIATLSERCLPPRGYALWGDAIEEAHVSHHCGATELVDTLEQALVWARAHSCTTTSPTKEPT